MLASLDENYEPLITALEVWDSKKHTVEAVRAKLVEEFSRKNPDGDEAQGIAMRTFQRQKSDRPTCYGCGKRGHIHRDCRISPLKLNSRFNSDSRSNSNAARQALYESKMSYIYRDLYVNKQQNKTICQNFTSSYSFCCDFVLIVKILWPFIVFV
jgi:hypothetical protein